MTRMGGSRRKTRHKMLKPIKSKGKLSITRYLQTFNTGDKVVLKAEPAYQKGIYFRRFHGKSAVVEKKIGNCYNVMIQDAGKKKELIVHPVHLRRV